VEVKMLEFQSEPFDERLGRIAKRHRKLAHGYVNQLGSDGLITARPVRRFRFPWKFMIVIAAFCLLVKGATFAALGEATYSQRVATLSQGSVAERAGAFLMQADPVTHWVAGVMHPIFARDVPVEEAVTNAVAAES